MGKKRRKLKNRIKCNERRVNFAHDPNVKDNHHLLWVSTIWNKQYYARLLRNYWYCQIYIPKNTLHKSIHEEIRGGLSLPSDTTCRAVYNKLLEMEKLGELSSKDPIGYRLKLLISLFGNNDPATVKGLRKQLNIAAKFYNGGLD